MKGDASKGSLKDIEQKRKQVYKPILDHPYTQGYEYPNIAPQFATSILDFLTSLLKSYGAYLELKKKKGVKISVPDVHDKITIGFNSTVARLEKQAQPNRDRVYGTTSEPVEAYVKYVFVAKSDMSSSLLTSSFPILAYTASRSLEDRVKLVELPEGAMQRLSSALNTKNVGVLSLQRTWEEGKPLFDIIDKHVPDVNVPWLSGLFGEEGAFEAPAIKFVKTSMPIGKRQAKGQGQTPKAKNRKKAAN